MCSNRGNGSSPSGGLLERKVKDAAVENTGVSNSSPDSNTTPVSDVHTQDPAEAKTGVAVPGDKNAGGGSGAGASPGVKSRRRSIGAGASGRRRASQGLGL